jgi:hypothetical protein
MQWLNVLVLAHATAALVSVSVLTPTRVWRVNDVSFKLQSPIRITSGWILIPDFLHFSMLFQWNALMIVRATASVWAWKSSRAWNMPNHSCQLTTPMVKAPSVTQLHGTGTLCTHVYVTPIGKWVYRDIRHNYLSILALTVLCVSQPFCCFYVFHCVLLFLAYYLRYCKWQWFRFLLLGRCPSGDNPFTTLNETDCEALNQTRGTGIGFYENYCHHDCSGRGLCDHSTGRCSCFEGSMGANCAGLASPFLDITDTMPASH